MLLHLGELLHLGLQQPTGQNISGLFVMNLTSHVIKHRQHLIERDEDLHAVIEWKNKKSYTLRSKQANNHRDLQITPKLLSSRQHEQRAWIIPTESLRVTQQMLVWRSSAWKCSMAVSDNDNTIFQFYLRDSSTVFSLIELLIFALKRERRISRL